MKILVIHAPAGHGHKKAAEIAAKVILQQGHAPQEVRIEDALDYTPAFFKYSYLNIYFQCVKYVPRLWGWFYLYFDQGQFLGTLSRPFRRLMNHLSGLRLLAFVRQWKPDVIISTHFYASEILAWAKTQKQIRAHLLTIVTDFYAHALWVNQGTDTYWVMGDETRRDLIRRGVNPQQIKAEGIPVDLRFKPEQRKTDILNQYGFDPKRFTLLIASGSFGIGAYDHVLRSLEPLKDRIQCFVVCGNNQAMEKSLSASSFPFPVKIFGFVNFMHDLMEASDLMITKSGGLTSSESLAKGIPMIVTQPIPGQETRNTDFLKFHEASFFIHEPSQVRIVLENILKNPELLERKRDAIRRIAKPGAALALADFVASLRNLPHA